MSVASHRMISAAARRFQSGWRKFRAEAIRFREEKRGSVFPLFAFSIIPLIGASGLAVDATKAFMVKDQLQKSIDAAALAAGHSLEPGNMQADAQQFFDANFHFDSSLAGNRVVNVQVDQANETVTITASAVVPTSFMTVLGYDEIAVSASTVVERQVKGMELILVMDNTGSMRWSGKIGASISAAQKLVDTVFGNKNQVENLWVGVVPYVAYVNVGNQHSNWLQSTDAVFQSPSPFTPTSWKGCVMARSGGRDLTDEPPTSTRFTSFLWEDAADNDWIRTRRGRTSYRVNENHLTGRGPNGGCPDPITSLTDWRPTIKNAIADMTWWPRGGTHINQGLVWGWRALSPRWRGLWGGATPAELPLDYSNTLMEKVVVLLTDGRNEYIASSVGGSHKSAHGRIVDFGYATVADAEVELNNRTAQICTNMKAEGIMLYMITFGSTPNATIQGIMRNCATTVEHYYHAPDNSTLQTIFRAIGEKLSNLRIVQ